MPQVKDGGQASFEDVPLNDPELLSACDDYLEQHEAAKVFRNADQTIKERLPAVKVATRFIIGERIFIEVTPHKRGEYSVKAGTTQRKKVLDRMTAE